MKNIKKISATALIIISGFISQNVIASTYPTTGVGVDNSASQSNSSSGYIAPASTLSPVILGGDGTVTTPYVAGDFDTSSPYEFDSNGDGVNDSYYYLLKSGSGFKSGDYVQGAHGTYMLSVSLTVPGYLTATLISGSTGGDDLGNADVFYAMPVGNGNIILVVLILTYTTYIFYRKKKKEKVSEEKEKGYPFG